MSVSKWEFETDITYCMCDCVFTRCDRHISNAPKEMPVSQAYLFNTDVCPMKIRRRKEDDVG